MVKNAKLFRTIVLILLLVLIAIVILQRENLKKEEQFKKELELLYEDETFSLGMDTYNCYKDFSYVNVNVLIINLAAYKHFKDGEEITVEEVKTFLSSEYDENGELYVLNPPDDIAKFIKWYRTGGRSLTDKYFIYLCRYQDDHSDKYSLKGITMLDVNMLYELIEDFENCPNREDYEVH
jgi:hypothetical protein